MQSWEQPTAVKHGIGCLENLGEELTKLGVRKPLIVTDQGVRSTGLVERVEAILDKAGFDRAVFDRVKGNPPVELAGEGSQAYRDYGCDGLVAVGGGSSMDTAKAIGVEVAHGGCILDYEYGKKPIEKRIPPLITVPTTAGTGSEVTLWAVITDTKRRIKFNVGGTPLIGAHVALIDPALSATLPPNLTAWTGLDALSHAVECYTMTYAQPITDAVALLAIEYIGKYLRRAYAYGRDMEARYKMAMAATLAGMAYGVDSAGAVHAMAQTFGGYIDVHHGYLTAVMLPVVMEYNWMGNPEKFARIAQAMGEDIAGLRLEEAAKLSVKAVAALVEDLEVPPLSSTGVTEKDVPVLAKMAFEDPQTVGNPRDLDLAAYERMYRRLLAA